MVECILCPYIPSVPLPPPAPFKQIMEDFLFEKLWLMLYEHGASAKKKEGTRRYWSTLSSEQQQHVLITISRKLEEGRFVQFDPIRAIKENTPKVRKLVMSAEEYYRRYGTQTNQEGWVRTFLKDRQETIYVKLILN